MDIELKASVSLKELTTLKVGGIAKNFYLIRSFGGAQKIVKELSGEFYLLGNGSNLLINDGIIQTPVLSLGRDFDYIKEREKTLEIGAATPLAKVINYCLKQQLAGFEHMAGIPAKIGGLLAMNASCFGREVCAFLKEVEAIDKKTARLVTLKKNEITFGYRNSSLRDYLILRAWFCLENVPYVKEKAGACLKERFKKQDYSLPNCGCVFKNPSQAAAGQLIDSCGLKGLKHGNAMVSLKHANFILNTGNALYQDVDTLISQIKDRVYKQHGIMLEEEIQRWV